MPRLFIDLSAKTGVKWCKKNQVQEEGFELKIMSGYRKVINHQIIIMEPIIKQHS